MSPFMASTRGATSVGTPRVGKGPWAAAPRPARSCTKPSSRPSARFIAQPTTIHDSGTRSSSGATAPSAALRANSALTTSRWATRTVVVPLAVV